MQHLGLQHPRPGRTLSERRACAGAGSSLLTACTWHACCAQVYFEAFKDKDIFDKLFHKDDVDSDELAKFKKDCKKEKLIFTASVTGLTRTSVRAPCKRSPGACAHAGSLCMCLLWRLLLLGLSMWLLWQPCCLRDPAAPFPAPALCAAPALPASAAGVHAALGRLDRFL